jgi:hypothetical protein
MKEGILYIDSSRILVLIKSDTLSFSNIVPLSQNVNSYATDGSEIVLVQHQDKQLMVYDFSKSKAIWKLTADGLPKAIHVSAVT